MSRLITRILLLTIMVSFLAQGLFAAPSARPAEGRRKAIELIAQGQAQEQEGDMQGAMDSFAQSVQLAPSPAGCYHLGRLCAKSGKMDEARKYLQQAVELNPDYELAKMELSNLGVPSAGSANVDSVQAEVETLQSLRKPAEFVEAQPVPAPDKPKRRLIPRVFQKRGEGDASAVPNMFAAAPQLNTAPEAANPVPPSMTGDQAAVKVVTTGGEPRGSAPVIAAAAANENVAEPAAIPGQRLAVEDGGKPAKDAAAPMPSVEQVNKVAFGAESRAERGSIGYGNTTKVALGTFAFHREKGDTYRKAQRWVEAADEYETALRLSPGDTGTRALLAEALANAGEGDISDVQFRKAASEAPGDARVPYRQGNVYREQKKPDLAIGAYRQAIDLDPRNKFAHNNLGVVYMEKGDYAKAAASLKRVLEIDPAYDKAMLNLGIIYDDHLGDKEQALKYYDMYVKAKGERSGEVRGWANAIRGTQQP